MANFVNPLTQQQGWHYIATVLLLSWLTAFGPLCTDMYLPSLPSIAADLQISTALTQGSITACLLGLALGQVFIGPLSDGQGRHKLLLASLALFTVASVLCAFSTSGAMFLSMRFLQGLGGAGGTVLARAVCCDTYKGTKLTQFMSLLMAVHALAPILGPLVGGLLAIQAGWQGIFYALAAIGVVLFVSTFMHLPETLAPEARIPGGIVASLTNTGRLFKEKAFLCYAGVQGFTMGGFFCYISASPFVFQNMYGLSSTTYSLIFGCNAIGILCASLVAGKLSRLFGDRALLSYGDVIRCVACIAVLVIAIMRPSSPVPMMIALFSMVSIQGITLTASFTLAISSQTTGSGAASGILGVAVFIFGSCTSPLAGLAGPESALPLGIVCVVTGLASLILSRLGNKLYEQCPARSMSAAERLAIRKRKAREQAKKIG